MSQRSPLTRFSQNVFTGYRNLFITLTKKLKKSKQPQEHDELTRSCNDTTISVMSLKISSKIPTRVHVADLIDQADRIYHWDWKFQSGGSGDEIAPMRLGAAGEAPATNQDGFNQTTSIDSSCLVIDFPYQARHAQLQILC